MSNAPFNISLVFRADTTGAKAGLTDVTTGLKAVSTEAGKASAATAKEAADLNALAQATAKAARAQDDLAAAQKRAQAPRASAPVLPLANPTPTVAPVAAAFRQSETSAAALSTAVTGLNTTVGQLDDQFVAAGVAAVEYQAKLDAVRASFNPLFAASRQYEAQLERIADAERLGAISAREAADARARAAAIIAPSVPAAADPTRPGAGGGSTRAQNVQNASYQLADAAVQFQGGVAPSIIVAQQLPQMLGSLGMWGAVAGAAVAVGAPLIKMWLDSGNAAGSLDDRLERLNARLEGVRDRLKLLNDQNLEDTFGSLTAEIREMTGALLALERAGELKELRSSLDKLLEGVTKPGLADRFKLLWTSDAAMTAEGGLALPAADQLSREHYANLTGGRGPSFEEFGSRRAEIDDLAKSGNVEAVTGKVSSLIQDFAGSGPLTDLNKDLLDALLKMGELATKTAEVEALFNGTGKDNAIKRQADEMVRAYTQQIGLQQTAARYGQDSIQYRQAENAQARANLILDLQKLGIKQDDSRAQDVLAAQQAAFAAREDQIAAARKQARQEHLQGLDDAIAASQRDLGLLGATNAERIRATALAQAELEIRRSKLGVADAELERAKALAKAEADIALDRGRGLRAASVAAMGQSYDAQIALARDPVSQANLEFQREFFAQLADGQGVQVAYANAVNARNRAMSDALVTAQSSIASMMDEVAIRRDLQSQIDAGLITSADANRLLQEETTIRPLLAAAARAEGAEKRRLLDVVEGLRVAYAALAAEEIRDGVTLMIQQAFDGFIRDMLPTQVRAIVNDRWGS